MIASSITVTCALSDAGIRLSSPLPLVQVTLVAGPPVEIQVRMESINIEILDMVISPGHSGMNDYSKQMSATTCGQVSVTLYTCSTTVH